MQHADKHKGFWRPGFTIPRELVDHIPAEHVDHSGKPLKGRRWVKGPSTRIPVIGGDADMAQRMITAYGERYIEPAIEAARRALKPSRVTIRYRARPELPAPWLRLWHDHATDKAEGVAAISGGFDEPADKVVGNNHSPMIDVTPANKPVDLNEVMDFRESDLHADGKRSRPQQAVDRRKAWRFAMQELFKWGKERGKPAHDDMGTYSDTDMEAYRTYLIRLDMQNHGTLSFHRIYAIRAMFRCAKLHKLIAADPTERDGFQPRKQKRPEKPHSPQELARILPAALRSPKPSVKFPIILSRYTGANNSEIFEAMASEFYEIDGRLVWDTRGRILKDPRGDGEYRGRLTPLHLSLTHDAGFVEYLATRQGKRLFDGSANVHGQDCNDLCHQPDDQEKIGKSFKSLRKVFTDQITKLAGKVLGSESMGEYLSGHQPGSIHRGWYIFHTEPENFGDVVKVIDALPPLPAKPSEPSALPPVGAP